MSTTRVCDVCHFVRQDRTGASTVHRYGLSRQVQVPGRSRPGRPNSGLMKRERHYGGIDMCDECWERIGKPKKKAREVA